MRFKKIRLALGTLILGRRRAIKKMIEADALEYYKNLFEYTAMKITMSMPEYQKGWLGVQLSKAPAELLRDAIKLNENLTETQKVEIEQIIDRTPSFKGDYLQ